MSKKIDELVVCPYCNDCSSYVFKATSETLLCNSCGKEFEIELESVVKVVSYKIYDKICSACNTFLFNEEIENGSCPKCGCTFFEDNELLLSTQYSAKLG